MGSVGPREGTGGRAGYREEKEEEMHEEGHLGIKAMQGNHGDG
jgi:hypothetical protein